MTLAKMKLELKCRDDLVCAVREEEERAVREEDGGLFLDLDFGQQMAFINGMIRDLESDKPYAREKLIAQLRALRRAILDQHFIAVDEEWTKEQTNV